MISIYGDGFSKQELEVTYFCLIKSIKNRYPCIFCLMAYDSYSGLHRATLPWFIAMLSDRFKSSSKGLRFEYPTSFHDVCGKDEINIYTYTYIHTYRMFQQYSEQGGSQFEINPKHNDNCNHLLSLDHMEEMWTKAKIT